MTDLLLRLVVLLLAAGLGARWLRVAQREHYLGGRGASTWLLWLRTYPRDIALFAVAAVVLVAGLVVDVPVLALAGAAAAATLPLGLAHRGRTSKLAWTPRLRRLAAAAVVVLAFVVLLAPWPVALALAAMPFLAADLGALVMAPVEQRLGRRYLVQAQEKIRRVAPRVVAITGSFGKTTTKQYLAHLLQGLVTVVPSPASFNNAMGLSRAVNEHLLPGTDVFIAEMGTYGRGEIRRLCEIFVPEVSVITAIGEVHLERMKTQENILKAKAEIAENARRVVLNVDDPRLAALAERLGAEGREVLRYSTTDPDADVAVLSTGGQDVAVRVRGSDVASVPLPASVHPSNAAAALAAGLALDVDPASLANRLSTLPSVANRLEPQRTPNGGWVLDDTYNSNPVGARAAVDRACALAAERGGSVHVITPGMVELGPVQAERNEALARHLSDRGVATLVIVGQTNRRALAAGAGPPATTVIAAPDRAAAVRDVEGRVGQGDVVLFENDLPDHYP
jgi:UDP-N-acetylmuramoyl-tripeptide--D-alanyl-D-alanine ligase